MKKRYALLALLTLAHSGSFIYSKDRNHEKSSCCQPEKLNRSFEACLSFDQLVVEGENGPRPRSEDDRPGTGKDEVCGTFSICFNEDLTEAKYRLTVCNVNKNSRTKNENVLGAALYFGFPLDPETSSQNIAVLCDLDNFGDDSENPCGEPGDICCTGTLTNTNLTSGAPTVASLYELIRLGLVFVLVNGSNVCEPNNTPYGLPFGLIRGHIFAPNMTG